MREAAVSVTDFEAMGVGGLLTLVRDAGLRSVEELACRGNGAVIQVEVESRIDEEALTKLEYVESWNHVAERTESDVYVMSFTAPALPSDLAATAEELIGTCDPELAEDGATLSLVGPQGTIAGQVRAYERSGASPTLERIADYEGPQSPLDELTARQREVLRAAWDRGYYEVPRDASTDEIARELNVDSSTVNEHLQRAERNLLAQFL